jgi:3-dehydroquinate synthase
VEQDEKENGLRKILNFGHTYAHAIENITKYKKYTHGEAVVAGIRFVFSLAERKGLIDKNYKYWAEDILSKFNFMPIHDFPNEKILKAMKLDKKAECDKILFIIPTDYFAVREYSLSPDEIF